MGAEQGGEEDVESVDQQEQLVASRGPAALSQPQHRVQGRRELKGHLDVGAEPHPGPHGHGAVPLGDDQVPIRGDV